MKRFDYYRAAACTPPLEIGNPHANARAILDLCAKLPEDTQLAVFPELCLSGYTCQDLFYESALLEGCLAALEEVAASAPAGLALLLGLPLRVNNRLYNAAAFVFGGEVLGFYAKTYLPGYNEYYEPRWFSSSHFLEPEATVLIQGRKVPVRDRIVFADTTTGAVIGP